VRNGDIKRILLIVRGVRHRGTGSAAQPAHRGGRAAASSGADRRRRLGGSDPGGVLFQLAGHRALFGISALAVLATLPAARRGR
jgi:hypothetical protein